MRGGATGIAPEHDEGEHVDEHERVAQRAVDVGAPPPQPAEQTERDDEVRVVVVVGDRQPERVVAGEPAVERVLGVEVQRALEAAARPRAWASASVQAQRGEVGDRVVHPAQPGDRQHLHPPARARASCVQSAAASRPPRRPRWCSYDSCQAVDVIRRLSEPRPTGPTGSSPRRASVSSTRGSAAAVRRHEPGAE